MDERLIFDAHRLATQYVNDMVTKQEKMAKVIKKEENIRLEKVQRVKERKEQRKMNLFKKIRSNRHQKNWRKNN